MDAKEFIKERNRMCKAHKYKDSLCSCRPSCPASKISCNQLSFIDDALIDIVEKWSKENPVKTNAMKFKEVFDTTEWTFMKDGSGKELSTWILPEEWLNAEYKEPKNE